MIRRAKIDPAAYVELFAWEQRQLRRRRRRVLVRIWSHYGWVPTWLRYTS